MKLQQGILPSALIAVTLLLTGLSCTDTNTKIHDRLTVGEYPDTLRVTTLYSPTSFFIYREDSMGLDYSMVKRLAADKSMTLDIHVAPSLSSMIEMLDSDKVDLIAYPVPVTAEYRDHVIDCGPLSETHQVLVQPRRAGIPLITDVTQLPGHEVYVEKDSKYYYRMLNLNAELGGDIMIHAIDRDTLITEDLIEMVSDGTLPLTVIDSDIARLNRTYYPNLDVTLALSFPQRSAWAVSPRHQWLADSIDEWISGDRPRSTRAGLLRRYFELSKTDPATTVNIDLTRGHISPYDDLFRQHAATIGYDWRLLASQGYIESQFDTTRVSWAGARGIMQIMPSTAKAYGGDPATMDNPGNSIEISTRVLRDLDRALSKHVSDSTERTKFVLGAYNAGLAHIYDAIALAGKHGYNPQVWDGNVAECLLLKSMPEYYNDPVCKWGYFRGRQTVVYVEKVMKFYIRCKQYINS
ncbi:MAG: transglycosylase SLT domain-containing protein [Clostridiales bacterium]|nr:transglycosylase SLT domain-containing protein [Clostridiales bacterium]